jgi:hypothetical protein
LPKERKKNVCSNGCVCGAGGFAAGGHGAFERVCVAA